MEITKKAVHKTDENAREAIRRASAYALPDNPSARGMKPDDLKRAFWQPVVGTTQSMLMELDRVVNELNLCLSDICKMIGKGDLPQLFDFDGKFPEIYDNLSADGRTGLIRNTLYNSYRLNLHVNKRVDVTQIGDSKEDPHGTFTAIRNRIVAHNVSHEAHPFILRALETAETSLANEQLLHAARLTELENRATLADSKIGTGNLVTETQHLIGAVNEVASLADRIKAVSDLNRVNLTNLTAQIQGISRSYAVPDFLTFYDFIRGLYAIKLMEDRDGDGEAEEYLITVADLITGDNVYIVEQAVPDFWYEKTTLLDTKERYEYEGILYDLIAAVNGETVGLLHVSENDYSVTEEYAVSASASAQAASASAQAASASAQAASASAQAAKTSENISRQASDDAQQSADDAENAKADAEQACDKAIEAKEYVHSEAEKLDAWQRVTFEKSRIYGVDGVGQSNPTLTRTDDAIGLSYSVGASEITSDFNNCYPWSDICEITDEHGNVFVKIPKFYSKVTPNADGTYKYQISGVRHVGFSTLFIDGKGNEIDYVLVGKYEGSGTASQVYSKSGKTVLTNITMDNFRMGCKANGTGYQQYDFLIDWIIKYLFTIEFATANCQSIMQGWTNESNTMALLTGKTDTVKTPTGSPTDNSTGYYACKYRGIENPWGNVWKWCDGISFSAEKVFVCTEPTSYQSAKVSAPYFYMGNRCMTSGHVRVMTPFEKMPLLSYVTETMVGGSNMHYFGHYLVQNNSPLLSVGGSWAYSQNSGLWTCSSWMNQSSVHINIGGRLCYKPIQGGVLNG